MSPQLTHFPVMSSEVVNYLSKIPNGLYVDCTFGAGGHSRQLLKNLGEEARVIGLDVDNVAVNMGLELAKEDNRFSMWKINFADFAKKWREQRLPKINGIIFDLGCSTMQLKNPERGFSYHGDNFLDMRMDTSSKVTASDILNNYSKRELSEMFKKYGDIKNPSKLVNLISCYRKKCDSLHSIEDFRNLVEEAFNHKRPEEIRKDIRRCFQALRIETNNELNSLEKALDSLQEIMAADGIICVITFHSIEERIIREWKQKYCDTIQIHDYSENVLNKFRVISDGYVVPTHLEILSNWSSRSAKLWVIQKVKNN